MRTKALWTVLRPDTGRGEMTRVGFSEPVPAVARGISSASPSRALGLNFTVVLIGNLIGSLFVAYFLAVKTGVIGVLRALGCN